MKITALEEYGLRCLLHVARGGENQATSAQFVSDKEGLSLPYTQKILRILSKGGLIRARRGVHGGYVLTRPVEEISMGDTMRVLGGMIDVEEMCERYTGELPQCSHGCGCVIKPVWTHISNFVVRTLDAVSIATLLNDTKELEAYLNSMTSETKPVNNPSILETSSPLEL